MRYYIHSGTGATVYVDETGKKMIVKYGKRFRNYTALKQFERAMESERQFIQEIRDTSYLKEQSDTLGVRRTASMRRDFSKARGE